MIEFGTSQEIKAKQFAKVKVPKKLVPRIKREQVWIYAPLLLPVVHYVRDRLPEGSLLKYAFDNPVEFAFRGFRRNRGKQLRQALTAVAEQGVERNVPHHGPWFKPGEPAVAMYYACPNEGEVGVIIVTKASGLYFEGDPLTYTAQLVKGQIFRDLHVGTVQFELVSFKSPFST